MKTTAERDGGAGGGGGMTQRFVLGDALDGLADLDLSGSVVITDPPWRSDVVDIVGAGKSAEALWESVAGLLGGARAVVVYQSAIEAPFAPPPLPFYQTCWMRMIPPSYRGTKIGNHVAYVYGHPPRPSGARVHAAEANSTSAESRAARRGSAHPCPMSLDHARWLVRQFAAGCRVVDPFCGDGTVLAAAAEVGLEAVGFEVDPRWVDGARARIERARAQTLMPWAPIAAGVGS